MLYCEGSYLDTIMLCSKREKELEGVPIGFGGIMTDPFDVGKIMIEELMNKGGELHCFLFCHREKSTRFLRL